MMPMTQDQVRRWWNAFIPGQRRALLGLASEGGSGCFFSELDTRQLIDVMAMYARDMDRRRSFYGIRKERRA
jgi:hypothetical protein